jgi:hypothetical protein
VQAYGPEALWADFRRDFESQYPGFEILEKSGNLGAWKGSRTSSPPQAYQVISAVFGDLTEPIRKREQEGKLNTASASAARIRKCRGTRARARSGGRDQGLRL